MWRLILLVVFAFILLAFLAAVAEAETSSTLNITTSLFFSYSSYNGSLESIFNELQLYNQYLTVTGINPREHMPIQISESYKLVSQVSSRQGGPTGLSFEYGVDGYIYVYSKRWKLVVKIKPQGFGGQLQSIALYVSNKWVYTMNTTVDENGYYVGVIEPPIRGTYGSIRFRLGIGHSQPGYWDPTNYSLELGYYDENNVYHSFKLLCNGTVSTHRATRICCGASYVDYIEVTCNNINIPNDEIRVLRSITGSGNEGIAGGTGAFPGNYTWGSNVSLNISFGSWYPKFNVSLPSKPGTPGFETLEGVIISSAFIALWLALGYRMGFIHAGIVTSGVYIAYAIAVKAYGLAVVSSAVFAFLLVYSNRTGKI